MKTDCIIYFTTELEIDNLTKIISDLIKGRITTFNSIKGDNFFFDLNYNSDFNSLLQSEFPDGFLYFKYRLEITFQNDVQINYCIEVVQKILQFFWTTHIPAVAACEYEETLTLKGGYKSKIIPWPALRSL